MESNTAIYVKNIKYYLNKIKEESINNPDQLNKVQSIEKMINEILNNN